MDKIYINSAYFTSEISGLDKYFQAKDLRRMDIFTKLALKAAAMCLNKACIDLKSEKTDIALIISTGYGPVAKTCDFMNSIIDDGDECASALAFSSSVHNSALTSVSILLNIKGPALTVSNLETSFESAILAAKTWLKSGMASKVLIGAVDEIHNVIEKVLKTNPVVFETFKNKELSQGAAFLLLSNHGRFEISELETAAEPLNPSAAAFKLAYEAEPMLTYEEVKRIAADFIKTELARVGHNIMDVFENPDANDIFKQADFPLRLKIASGLTNLFCAEAKDIKEIPPDITKDAFENFEKNRIINFFTSGSTGSVKNCLHKQNMIREEAEGLSFLFKNIKRVICTVPSSHSYGFIFGLQIPKLLGVPVEVKPPLPVFSWSKLLQNGDLLIAFPMFLKQLVFMNFIFPDGITVLTSTAPCPDELIEKLYESKVKRLIEIYGACESGAIGWREKAFAPFCLLPFWDGIVNNDKLEGISRKTTELQVNIPDILNMQSGGTFKLAGRKDNAVQVAGINVFPGKVEAILKKHPAVSEVSVRLMRPEEGERLKAFIVLKEGITADEISYSLRAFMKNNLTVHEVPRSITFGSEIPTTNFGKKKDW